MSKKYWSSKAILDTKADIMMVLGEKGNGKSYEVKQYILNRCYKNNEKFAYFRRFREDIKDLDIYEWLADMVIDNKGNKRIYEITNGEYDDIKVFRGEIFFSKKIFREVHRKTGEIEEVMETIKGPLIGKAFYVSEQGYQHTASHAYVNYTMGVYEEFITVGRQSDNEPEIFMKMVSTIFRDNKYQIFLLGNRISRHNPYFREWQLEGALRQKVGTIDIYIEHRYDEVLQQDIEMKLAIEQCPVAGSSAKIWGNVKNSILGGNYDVKSKVALFRDKFENYDVVYEILFNYSEKYILRAMVHKETGNCILVVGIYTRSRKIKRVIQNEFSFDPYITNGLNLKINAEKKIQELIRNGKICYLDKLTGTEFPLVYNSIGGGI